MTEITENETFNPARQLCPDGACLGVVGPDGSCRVCGRKGDPGFGARPASSGTSAANDDDNDDGGQDGGAGSDADYGAGAAGASGGFDSARRLCPDGACVGVIGPDGRCGVCGREGES